MNFNINKFDNQLETYIKKLKKNGTMQIELEEREEREERGFLSLLFEKIQK